MSSWVSNISKKRGKHFSGSCFKKKEKRKRASSKLQGKNLPQKIKTKDRLREMARGRAGRGDASRRIQEGKNKKIHKHPHVCMSTFCTHSHLIHKNLWVESTHLLI